MLKRALFSFLAVLALAGPALAQTFPQVTLPPSTVFGRLPGTAGPGEAIPFTTLAQSLNQPTNSVGLLWQAPAGATQGQGCSTTLPGHFVGFIDQNTCYLKTVDQYVSNDASILATVILGGTVNSTGGAGERITFTFGSGTCAAGCNVDYTNVGGDTTATIAATLSNLIKADARLYNGAATSYLTQGQVIWSTPAGGPHEIDLDLNGTVATKVTFTALNGSTVTGTPSGTCSSGTCGLLADVPLQFLYAHKPGFTVAANSTILQDVYSSTFSGGNGVYAEETITAVDPTQSLGSFLFSVGSSPILGGVYISKGVYGISESDPGKDGAAFQNYVVANPNNSSTITIENVASTVSHVANLPALAADDTFAFLGRAQTFTGANQHNGAETFIGGATFNTVGVSFGDGGTWTVSGINGSNIGSSTPGTGKFTTLTDTGLSVAGVVTNTSGGLLGTALLASANTASAVVQRDGSGNFAAGTITASLTGHASLDLATSALGTGVATALGNNTGSAGGFTVGVRSLAASYGSGTSSTLNAATTAYLGEQNNFSGNQLNAVTVSNGGTLKNLYLNAGNAPVGAQTYIVTVYSGTFGSASLGAGALTCTITGAAVQCSDLTHSITLSAGQAFAVQIVSSATAASLVGASWSVEFDSS